MVLSFFALTSPVASDGWPLYLRAMDEIGADTTLIRGFTAQIELGAKWEGALAELRIVAAVRHFVSETLTCANHGSNVEVRRFFSSDVKT
jgi:hypothetical protein